ncbi:hypothetical protein H3N56_11265 [Cetobacterium sp. 2A]|uniref:hypothetical protein n=1 Tax=Cetobacterium sp. 2A TaxID=2754723 RepID=UPI00163B731D|nr:hypothetical protein [Cetobacterium sp. 2A]MBC2857012.1 hypothetical protein [Cetobacterium sp. 2A]
MIKRLLFLLILVLNIISFSEVPHIYIYDNPSKQVTTTETLKKKPNGSEMNISVEKIKTEEIEGVLDKGAKKIYLTIDDLGVTDKLIVTDTLKNIQNPQRLISKYDFESKNSDIDISIERMNLNSKLYLIVLNSSNNLKCIKKVTSVREQKLELKSIVDNIMKSLTRANEIYFEFTRDYLWNTNQVITGEHTSELTKEVEISFAANSQTYASHRGNNRTAYGRTYVDVTDANGALIESRTFTWWDFLGGDNKVTVPSRVYYAKNFTRPVTVKLRWSLDLGGYKGHYNGGRADMSVISRVEQVFKYVVSPLEGTTNLTFNDDYQKNYANFSSTSYADSNPLVLENTVSGMNFSTFGSGLITIENGDILDINGVRTTVGTSGNLAERVTNIGTLGLKYKVENGKLRLGLNSWGVAEPSRAATVKVIRGTREVTNHIFNIQAPKRLEGTSRLVLKEYYPIDTYIAFSSANLNSPVPLVLENSIRDVILESSSQHGIVTMQQGDILEVNGVQSTIGASGNLGEKNQNIDTLDFKYKVENGKLRLALTGWGVLEPSRDLTIRVIRGVNEISKHIIDVKSPTKVDGDTAIKFDNTYQIRSFAKFKGIDLLAPLPVVLENHLGVTLETTRGSGIPFMNQGDILIISDTFRRSSNSFEIGASGVLEKKNIKLTNGEVGIQVEGGKLSLALNNWIVNKNVDVRVRIVRGTNEIMNHTFTLKAPDAPFNVVQQGILDFGTIIAGTKNKAAETDIKIEMIKDVTEIKFNLNTESPELYNKNGKVLKAKNLKTIVRKQSDKKYLIKIQGKLDVPQDQELGEYSGTAILEMRIK